MQGIAELLKLKPQKIDKTQKWQDQALEAIKILADGSKHKPSIFKCFKQDARTAEIALNDCRELGKLHSMYFFKVYGAIRGK